MFKKQITSIAHDDFWNDLGTGRATKMDEFSEKFQTAFDSQPPHFQKIILQIFFRKPTFIKPCIKAQNLQYNFLD